MWATVPFDVPPVGKSDLYRGELADAAVAAVLLAVERFASGDHKPLSQKDPSVDVVWRDAFRQDRRRIDWAADPTETVLRKLRGGDSQPGVLDEVLGAEFFLHGGHPEDELRGAPGALLGTRAGAVCRATADGAVWIPELRPRRASGVPGPWRRPAASVLADAARAARCRAAGSPPCPRCRCRGNFPRSGAPGRTSATGSEARSASSTSASPAAP